jgi:DNA uptake protein ComE-like DNA-binding protein
MGHGRAENGDVRARVRFSVLAVVILGLCLAGIAQSQDRDTRGLPKTSATAPRPEMRVDINHASVDELMKIPGMTRSWAGRIVRFRPYRTKLDLVEYGIVTSQVYDKIKDYVIAHQKVQ